MSEPVLTARKMTLHEYIAQNTTIVPIGDECDVNMVFFGVNVNRDADVVDLVPLLPYHGTFGNPRVNLLNGEVANYIEVGAWLGDQEVGLRLMALGAQLELWRVISPLEVNPDMLATAAIALAKAGMLAVVVEKAV